MLNNKFTVFHVNYIMIDDSNNTILHFIIFFSLLHAKHIWKKKILCTHQHINFIFKEIDDHLKEIDDHLDECEESVSELLADRQQLEAKRIELVGKIEGLDEILRKLFATRTALLKKKAKLQEALLSEDGEVL